MKKRRRNKETMEVGMKKYNRQGEKTCIRDVMEVNAAR